MTQTEIAFGNERAIIADLLISLLTNVRLTYLPDLEPADAYELLLTGAHVLRIVPVLVEIGVAGAIG